ncbi:PDZ domain containing protein 9 [Sarcoptes scabiei]|uniref:PDZ domain containing protein 9 n=1 Tax=Sarcoptes scabiei TaxID=52283 RepID=A0A132AKN4_SARSC|nr:PDZ domain containing protein 9 [Sarcoptes scabiei]
MIEVANYEHSDEEKSYNSVSPQSTKEEGYASEEQTNSQSETLPSSINQKSMNNSTSSSSLAQQQQPKQYFNRGSGRLSMINNNYDQWIDAADRQLKKYLTKDLTTNQSNTSQSLQSQTKEYCEQKNTTINQIQCDSSLGSMSNSSQEIDQQNQSNSHLQQLNPHHNRTISLPKDFPAAKEPNYMSVIIDLTKESGPLGIHVLPDNSIGSRLNSGLRIQGIEPGGRIDRDKRLKVGDTIVEVDGHSFSGIDFEKAQELFRSSLQNDRICLKIMQTSNFSSNCDTSFQNRSSQVIKDHDHKNDDDQKQMFVEGAERAGHLPKMATITPSKKHSPTFNCVNNNVNLIGYKPAASALVIANTRRIGKKYHIQLRKGEYGLGFTITTRDNPAGGSSPIYIKTILPIGASVLDGRLKPGDRLLEVCGIEMTGKSQEEAVKILRNLPLNSIVDLIVSRQELEVSPSPLMPRQLPPDAVKEAFCSSSNEREVMTFQIPLNDTGSAGLGISVKGKSVTTEGKPKDSGIYIKSVLHGGAASKDGRLKQDDQLININGIPLSGKTNSEAMETLTRATIKSAHQITLTIARQSSRLSSHDEKFNCSDNLKDQSYHHQVSFLRTDSYDISFNRNQKNSHTLHSSDDGDDSVVQGTIQNQSINNNTDSFSQEDSYRSSDNTVIYNNTSRNMNLNSEKIEVDMNDKNLVMNNNETREITEASIPAVRAYNNQSSLNDSRSSLSEDYSGERFRRDGFGRQSMSEKRHAQLDARTTDTYRRSKKSKDLSPPNQNISMLDERQLSSSSTTTMLDPVHQDVSNLCSKMSNMNSLNNDNIHSTNRSMENENIENEEFNPSKL